MNRLTKETFIKTMRSSHTYCRTRKCTSTRHRMLEMMQALCVLVAVSTTVLFEQAWAAPANPEPAVYQDPGASGKMLPLLCRFVF